MSSGSRRSRSPSGPSHGSCPRSVVVCPGHPGEWSWRRRPGCHRRSHRLRRLLRCPPSRHRHHRRHPQRLTRFQVPRVFRRTRRGMVLLATPPAAPRRSRPHRHHRLRRGPTPGDSRVKWVRSTRAATRLRPWRATPRTDGPSTRPHRHHRRPRRQWRRHRPPVPMPRQAPPTTGRPRGTSRPTHPGVSRRRCQPVFPLPGWPQGSPPSTSHMPPPTRATSPLSGALRQLRWGQLVQMDNHLKEGDACRRRRRSAVVATGSWERCPPRCRALSGTVASTRSWIETSRSWFSPMRRFIATTSWSRPAGQYWSRTSVFSRSMTSSAPSHPSSSPSR